MQVVVDYLIAICAILFLASGVMVLGCIAAFVGLVVWAMIEEMLR